MDGVFPGAGLSRYDAMSWARGRQCGGAISSRIVGGTAAWPLVAHAQQPMPELGFLAAVSPGPFAQRVAAFHRGLNETGFVEGQNLAIESRWAEEQYDRLPAMTADLVGRRVAVIVTYTDAAALAAKTATTTIPIVFVNGGDPVSAGIVHSLNRPGDNITGVSFYGVDLAPKQLSLLHELVSKGCRRRTPY